VDQWRPGWEPRGIFARRFSSAGSPVASEFQVNTFTGGHQYAPSATVDADGDFVIAWGSNLQDGSSYGVFGRRFSSTGSALASEFRVNTYTADNQRVRSVASAASGAFIVAWSSYGQDGSDWGVFARRFTSSGSQLAVEFQVSLYTGDYQRDPSVAVEPDGDFVVAWASNQSSGFYDIFAAVSRAPAQRSAVNCWSTSTPPVFSPNPQ
jgi:hypothetical protein